MGSANNEDDEDNDANVSLTLTHSNPATRKDAAPPPPPADFIITDSISWFHAKKQQWDEFEPELVDEEEATNPDAHLSRIHRVTKPQRRRGSPPGHEEYAMFADNKDNDDTADD